MKVTLIASTRLEPDAYYVLSPLMLDIPHADHLAELAGRCCYTSYDRPNPATAANEDYLANIIKQEHFSVLEHASMTLHVTGASRNMLLELERHRFLSFSVRSTRFVDESAAVFADAAPAGEPEQHLLGRASALYEEIVENGIELGLSRKKAREFARHVLPGGIATEFVVTGNMRCWRDVLSKRLSPHADAEIQVFARQALRCAKRVALNSFQDFEEV